MPPDDPILTESETHTLQETPAPASQQTAPVASPSLTRDDVAAMLSPLQQAIGALGQHIQQSTARPVHEAPDEEAFAQDFYKAPQATLHREVARAAHPLVSQVAELSSELLIDRWKGDIESKYGPGTYAQIFAPALDPVFEHYRQNQPEMLLNRKAIENAFKTVRGDEKNFDLLVERAAAHKKATEDAGVSQRNQMRDSLAAELGNLTGGFRKDSKPTLSDEHRQIIREMEKADGTKRNPDVLAAVMNTGDTFEEWQAAKKGLNGSATNKGAH